MRIKVISVKLNKEFKRAYFQGKFKAHPFLVTYMVKNKTNIPRCGITVSKKIGGAVERNRARRIIKRAYYELLKENNLNFSGYDLVFVARTEIADKKTQDVKKVMKKQIEFLLNGFVGSRKAKSNGKK